MQPTLAIASSLLVQDSQATIYVGSASSFEARFDQFRRNLDDASSSSSASARIFRVDLGPTDDVEDYSKHMLRRDSNRLLYLFGTHRHSRGNPIPFFNYWQAFAAGTEEQRLITIQRILRIIDKIRPDMIIVDQIYGTPFDGELHSFPAFGHLVSFVSFLVFFFEMSSSE